MIRKTQKKLSTTELTAIITGYNAQREIVAKKYNAGGKRLGIIMMVLVCVWLVAVLIIYNQFGIMTALITGIIGALIAGMFFERGENINAAEVNRLQEQLRKLVFPTVFGNIDDFRFEADTKGFVYRIPKTIMPEYNRSDWGDLIEGKIKGQSFAINEMHLEYRTSGKNSSTVTVFKGVAVRLQRRADKAPTLAVRNNRMALTKFASNIFGMGIKDKHIKILDDELEEQYDVHCSDQNYVEKVFSSDGIELFKTMLQEHARGQFQFATSDNHIYMLIEQGHDFFELPSINLPLDQVEDIIRLRKEMNGFLNLFKQMDKLLAVR